MLCRLRAQSLRRLPALLHLEEAAAGAAVSEWAPPAACPDVPPPSLPLWRHSSPLVRHLSTSPALWSSAEQPAPQAEAPLPSYEQLKARAAAGAAPLELLPGEAERFRRLCRRFRSSAAVKDQALALYVNARLFAKAASEFQEFLEAGMDAALRDALLDGALAARGGEAALFPHFAQFCLDRYTDDIKAYRDLVKTVDLRRPHQWFPVARSLRRRVVYHAGPTNSGKTYNALTAMRAARSGVYCGPLRLLAMEVYDTCNAGGTFCSLVTGQERRLVPGARHTACTVEMVAMGTRVDVAVIDEIQMMGDESRGWAWTRALMGVPANEVHVCGDGSALALVAGICGEMGEELEVRRYDRFSALGVEAGGLAGGYSGAAPGDCIVAFSRKDIYAIKQLVEQSTAHRACVVYGALPPETRRQQARLFNEEGNRYNVMVASDAVGMGLNLNIRRVVFNSLTKYEGGGKRVPVSTSMIKQIAGRAGRRSSQFQQGVATCLNPGEVARLQEAIDVPMEELVTRTAGLFPEYEHLEVFAGARPDEPFRSLLSVFGANALLDSSYFFCKQDSVMEAAALLERVPLALRDMYNFCMAPASARDPRLAAALLHFAEKYGRGAPCALPISVPRRVPSCVEELKHLEAAHQVVMLWLWLSYRFEEEAFPGRAGVEATAEALCLLLDKGLKRITRMSKAGRDVAGRAARPEMQQILEAFSGEEREVKRLERAERDRQGGGSTGGGGGSRRFRDSRGRPRGSRRA